MIRDLLQEACGAMQHNRRRTTLTMLGMAWGIATVVILLAFGSGFERAISLIFSSWGTDVIGAFPGRTSLQAGGSKAGSEVKLKLADVDYIRNEVPMIKGVTPIFDKGNGVTIQHDTRTYTNLFFTGVYPVYDRIRGFEVASGRGMSELDLAEHGRVAIIGDEAKRRLFSGEQALGQSIRINGVSFQVIGIYKHKVQGGDNNDNTMVVIPFTTMGDLFDTQYISGMFMDYEGENHQQIARVVRSVLAGHHNFLPDDRRAVFIADFKQDFDDFTIVTTALKVLAGLYRRADAWHWRHWPDEHHAGLRTAADAGDRRGEGAGRAEAAHPVAISGRGAGDYVCGRRGWNRDRLSDFVGSWRAAADERLRRQPASGRHSLADQRQQPGGSNDHFERGGNFERDDSSDSRVET